MSHVVQSQNKEHTDNHYMQLQNNSCLFVFFSCGGSCTQSMALLSFFPFFFFSYKSLKPQAYIYLSLNFFPSLILPISFFYFSLLISICNVKFKRLNMVEKRGKADVGRLAYLLMDKWQNAWDGGTWVYSACCHSFATLFSPSPKHSHVLDLPLTGQIKDQTIHVSTVITVLYLVMFHCPYQTSLLFTSLK